MARFFKHSNLCILRRIGGTPEPHVREDAIIAVELRWPKLFTIDGNNSFTLFAGRLSQQLFQPPAEIGDDGGSDDCDFVPAALGSRHKKYCLKMLGSSVEPDLLETIKKVFARSSLSSDALICTGSVESRTCSRGKPSILPNVIANTSGARLEPPMPS